MAAAAAAAAAAEVKAYLGLNRPGRYAAHVHTARATNDHQEYILACLALCACGEASDGHALPTLAQRLVHHEPMPPVAPAAEMDFSPAEGILRVCAAQALKPGDAVLLPAAPGRNRPCFVSNIQLPRAGKGGYSRAIVHGDDMFDVFPAPKQHSAVFRLCSPEIDVPVVKRLRYTVVDASAGGAGPGTGLAMLPAAGTGTEELREDVPLPADPLLRARLLSAVAAGRDVEVTVLSAMGEQRVESLHIGDA